MKRHEPSDTRRCVGSPPRARAARARGRSPRRARPRREPGEDLPAGERRELSRERHRSHPADAARAPRSRRRRGRASRRARARSNGTRSAVACTSTSRPSPVMTTFTSTSALRILGVVEVEQRSPVDDRRPRPLRPIPAAPSTARTGRAPAAPPRRRRRSRRSACRRRPGGRRSRARRFARRAPGSRRPRARERPISRWISTVRPPCFPRASLALGAVAGRGREQRVLGGHPAAPGAIEPARDAAPRSRPCRARGRALRPQDHPCGCSRNVGSAIHRPQLVGPAAVAARHAARPFELRDAGRARRRAIGSWRKRSPSSRNALGSPVVRKR